MLFQNQISFFSVLPKKLSFLPKRNFQNERGLTVEESESGSSLDEFLIVSYNYLNI